MALVSVKPFKVGFGYDSHRFMIPLERNPEQFAGPSQPAAEKIDDGTDVFDPERLLLIGGVAASATAQSKFGPFVARSDGDFVFHAAVNAVLSALGDPHARDIGAVFPNTDPALSGRDSSLFLARVAEMAASTGYAIEELKVTVKGVVRVDLNEAAGNLLRALGPAHGSCEVLVQGTSGEQIGSIGRGEGMEAYAVCLLAKRGLMELLESLLESSPSPSESPSGKVWPAPPVAPR